jgi:alpha-galactosidase
MSLRPARSERVVLTMHKNVPTSMGTENFISEILDTYAAARTLLPWQAAWSRSRQATPQQVANDQAQDAKEGRRIASEENRDNGTQQVQFDVSRGSRALDLLLLRGLNGVRGLLNRCGGRRQRCLLRWS